MTTEITLRQGDAILQNITDEYKKISFVSMVTVEPFGDSASQLNSAHEEFIKKMALKSSLSDVITDVRQRVGRANAESGISDLLAEIAGLDRKIACYDEVLEIPPRPSLPVIEGNVNRLRQTPSTTFLTDYRCGYLTAEILSEYREMSALAKRQKIKLKDQLLHLNVSTKIALDGSTEEFLKANNYL